MDREARSRLRKVVTQARHLLEEDIRTQLKRLGIEEGGKTIPAGRLTHLRPEDKELRDRILVAIRKEQVRNVKRVEAYDRYVQHVGFTYLNRLAALRAMEVRGLITETMIRRDQYAGMSRREYELSEREGLSDKAEITKRSLLEAFNEVSQEIKVLFDVNDEYSLLFPSRRTLDGLMDLLGKDVPEEDWREEDIIGWIYQYYNSEARSEFRKKRRKPRPDDIPVINQFYTPRWLVRALVDNTLGRLWLEMKGRMPKPGEADAPSEERLKNPQGETVDEYCSYIIPLRQDPPPREKKRVREIKVLDPACGSGHFLVYAFNVLYRMYLEDEPGTPEEEIPRLILENNLFGIDIDLRSVQLAALSLFLKAKEYNRDVKIRRMNLVCADVRITDGDLQKKFISRLEHDVDLQRIFAKLFKEFEYTYDVGSLLKVRAPFESLLEERRKGVQTKFRPQIIGQSSLSKKGSVGGQSELLVEEVEKGVLVKPAVTLEEMLEALLEFEREGMEKKDMGTMLFAAEAEKSVGLLTLLSQKYDVIVMNPPYGDMPKSAKDYTKEYYPRTHYDYYAAFMEQAVELCEDNGFVGMLTGRTFMFLRWFEKVRTEILLKDAKPEVLFDLNLSPADSILDEATGRWAATVVRKFSGENRESACVFIRLTSFHGEQKKIEAFEQALSFWLKNGNYEIFYPTKLKSLNKLPRMPYSYWVHDNIAELFEKHPPLDRDNAGKPDQPKIAELKVGLQTGDDSQFTRYWWEVKPENIALSREETFKGKKWVPFIKGGDAYYSDMPLVVNWENNGEEIKRFAEETGKPRVQNEDYYFKQGLCWSSIVSSVLMDFRILPKGCIFSANSHSLFPSVRNKFFTLMGLLNSSLLAFFFLGLDPTMHVRHIGYICQLPIIDQGLENTDIANFSKELHDIWRDWRTGDEKSYLFIEPWILQVAMMNKSEKPISKHPLARDFELVEWKSDQELRGIRGSSNASLRELAELCVQKEKLLKKRSYEIQELIDERVYDVYGVQEEDRKVIEEELKTLRGFPKTLKKTYKEAIKPEITVKEHVARLISYYIKLIMEGDPDGIVSLDELLKNIRNKIGNDFGKDQSQRVESEIAQVLGKPLKDWLAEDFFEFHVRLYERRPIIWQLSSANFSHRRSQGAFNCFLYYHKLSKDTIYKIRTRREYLKGALEGAKWKTERLRREFQNARDSGDKTRKRQLQREYEEALDEFNELQAFDNKLAEVSNPRNNPTQLDEDASWVERKIAEVRDNGWNPVIDYGVRVNIEPLKEAGLLHKAAYRVK